MFRFHLAAALSVVLLSLGQGCAAREVVIGTRGDAAVSEVAPPEQVPNRRQMPPPVRDAATPALERVSAGCGSARAAADKRVLGDAGVSTYLLDLPALYDGRIAYPLVFAYRSSEDTAASFRESLQLLQVVADAAIVVHPETPNATSLWNVNRDVPYFDAMLEAMLAAYCVDTSRIFVVGHAQGGMIASALACQRGDRVRASAFFAGTTPMGTCQGPVAVLIAQGTMDSVYPLRSGRNTRDIWARNNQCDLGQSRGADPAPCVEYASCGAPVRYCEYVGGHELPSFAASAVWRFFSAL